MSGLQVLIWVHVAISLVAIAAGLAVALGMTRNKMCEKTTSVFLWTTVATSVTGFFFPITKFTPALGFGIISMIILPISFVALYKMKLAGKWRVTYIATAMFALYLNVFVLVVQTFLKILKSTDPPSGPAFAAAQGAVLGMMVALTVFAIKRFKPAIGTPAVAAA